MVKMIVIVSVNDVSWESGEIFYSIAKREYVWQREHSC